MSDDLAIPSTNPRDKLIADLRVVIADAEELLRITADQAGQKATELRARMQRRLEEARADLVHLQGLAMERALDAGHVADDYVRRRPWQAVGFAAGMGFALGLLVSGRR